MKFKLTDFRKVSKVMLSKILLILLFNLPATAQTSTGLFFDQKDIPKLRERFNNDPLFAEFKTSLESVDREAEVRFMESEVRYNDHLYDIARLSRFAQDMAFHYVFTGKRESADLAVKAVRTIMKFPIWDYFLDGDRVMGLQRASAAAIAVSLTVEFLGDLIDPKERDAWLRVMGEKGNEPCFVAIWGMRYPERVTGWHINPASTYFEHRPGDRGWDHSRWPYILDKINLKAVPASALAIGALTHQKYLGESADSKRWIEQAIFSIESFRDLFEKDGSYQEGVSYAHYTTSHILQAAVPLKRILGVDLSDIVNWSGYVRFLQEMTMPTNDNPYEIINFSDAGQGAFSSVAFWTADQQHDRRAQWYGKNLARGHDQWSVLWYNPTITAEPPSPQPHIYKADLDWLVARTGYSRQDLVVAMRSGGPMNHEHADRNSIIVKAFGEQLVTDPHRPPYSFTDPSWMMRHTAGHSAVLIDGQGHHYVDGREGTNSSKAWAHIVRAGERSDYLFWCSDATPGYQIVNPDVASITRTVVVLHELPAIVLLDKVQKKTMPSQVELRFFAYNNDGKGQISADNNGFTTVRPASQMRGLTGGSVQTTYAVDHLPIPPEKANMYPFAQVSSKNAQKESLLITILLPEKGDGGKATGSIKWLEKEGCYRIIVNNSGKRKEVRVFDSGRIPEFGVY